jgi:hypothetical protein
MRGSRGLSRRNSSGGKGAPLAWSAFSQFGKSFLAPIEQRVGFGWRERGDFGVMTKAKSLPPAVGFKCLACRRCIHASLEARPFPIPAFDDGPALAVAGPRAGPLPPPVPAMPLQRLVLPAPRREGPYRRAGSQNPTADELYPTSQAARKASGAESAGRGDAVRPPPAPALAAGAMEGDPTADGKPVADFRQGREGRRSRALKYRSTPGLYPTNSSGRSIIGPETGRELAPKLDPSVGGVQSSHQASPIRCHDEMSRGLLVIAF